jgi:peptidoglycan/LPS O-acetylase OafA/YrhL
LWGWVGVDLFFVLSGFLITGILYDSLHKPAYFRKFYLRRTLRIFPLYYGVLLALVVATPLLRISWNRYTLSNFFYIANFFTSPHDPGSVYFLFPFRTQPHVINLGHFWTLCIEEQFYLAWPALVWLIRSRRLLLSFCVAVMVLMPLLRTILYLYHPQYIANGYVYSSSFFRVDTLLTGGALALWLRGTRLPTPQIQRLARVLIAIFPLTLLVIYGQGHHTAGNIAVTPVISTIGYTLIALSAACLIVFALDVRSAFSSRIANRSLIHLGRISYGLYIFHDMPIFFINRLADRLAPYHSSFLVFFIGFGFTYMMARLSYRYLEAPFLRMKDRLPASNFLLR